jgi:hypothetical protein
MYCLHKGTLAVYEGALVGFLNYIQEPEDPEMLKNMLNYLG